MIAIDPEAALELLDARDYYDRQRPGLGTIFQQASQRTLDAIETTPESFPGHRFATTPGVQRALFLPPPRFPYAFAFMMHPNGHPYVLAAEHLRRRRCIGRRGSACRHGELGATTSSSRPSPMATPS